MTNKQGQKNLQFLGYYKGKIDGIWGKLSKKASELFQKKNKITVTGKLDSKTRSKLLEVLKNVQKKLNLLNSVSLVIDGLFGNKTLAEVKKYQGSKKMSKTGILNESELETLLNTYFNLPAFPVNYIKISQLFKMRTHNGIDLSWRVTGAPKNQPIYAPLKMKIIENKYSSTAGNYVTGISSYNSYNDVVMRFLHMKDKSSYKTGSIIDKGKILGLVGTTGRSTGNHLHFEFWLVPKGYTYRFSQRYKYLKDPLKYVYVLKNQKIVINSNDKRRVLYE